MHEPSDGIAEEVERQLQLALAAGAVLARAAIAARQSAVEQAQRESEQAAQAVRARIDAERRLAAAHLQPVFDPDWWETAAPADIAEMWQETSTWRDPDAAQVTPTIFDHATARIDEEIRDRAGLEIDQLRMLAAVQALEAEHQATVAEHDPDSPPVSLEAASHQVPLPRSFDDSRRREQLRARLHAAGVPEAAIDARTLADIAQAREPTDAVCTSAASTSPSPRAHSAGRELRRQL
jgi:hypothetical protein